MTRHKKSRRSQRGAGWFGPDDPYTQSQYTQKKSWMSSLNDWWSGPSTGTYTGSYTSPSTGMFDTATNTVNGIANGTTQVFNKMTNPSSYSYSNPNSNNPTFNNPTFNNPTPNNPVNYNNNNLVQSYGGKGKGKGKSKTLKMKKGQLKGGMKGLGLTYYATPVSGLKVAEPTTFLKYGGKKNKSRRHKKH